MQNVIYDNIKRSILYLIGLLILIWFASKIIFVLIIFVAAFIFALAIKPIIDWLEVQKIPRAVGSIALVIAFLGLMLGVFLLITPVLIREFQSIADNIPVYAENLSNYFARIVRNYPEISDNLRSQIANEASSFIGNIIGGLSFLLTSIADFFILILVFLSTIFYTLINPQPLHRSLINLFPGDSRDKAEKAYNRGVKATRGWLISNLIIGGIQGIAIGFFLNFLDIPGFAIWAMVTFFSQFIPKIGPYLTVIPPSIVALAVGEPFMIIWIILFYIVLNELTDDLIGPYIRSKVVMLHPVTIIFMALAMYYVFGIFGALVGVPVAAFIKSFYDEFA